MRFCFPLEKCLRAHQSLFLGKPRTMHSLFPPGKGFKVEGTMCSDRVTFNNSLPAYASGSPPHEEMWLLHTLAKRVPPGTSSHLCSYWWRTTAVSKSHSRKVIASVKIFIEQCSFLQLAHTQFLPLYLGPSHGQVCLAFLLGFSPRYSLSDHMEGSHVWPWLLEYHKPRPLLLKLFNKVKK